MNVGFKGKEGSREDGGKRLRPSFIPSVSLSSLFFLVSERYNGFRMEKKHFQLRASDISALCGRHMYKQSSQAIWDLVTLIAPLQDEHAVRMKRITSEIEGKVRQGPCYLQAVRLQELNHGICRSAEQESMRVFDNFKLDITSNERKHLRRNMRSVYLKDRGIFMEIHTLKRLSITKVYWHPTEKRQRFFNRTFHCHDLIYTINGCVDGLEFNANGDIVGLIEIKTRRDKVHFPTHDLDQVTMYLILSGLPQARLVQDVNGHLHVDCIMTLKEAQSRWQQLQPTLENALRQATVLLDQHRVSTT